MNCCVADGLICQVHGGGFGGVSDNDPPDVDLLRLTDDRDGGVPMANCTDGGEIEFISQF